MTGPLVDLTRSRPTYRDGPFDVCEVEPGTWAVLYADSRVAGPVAEWGASWERALVAFPGLIEAALVESVELPTADADVLVVDIYR